MTFGTILFDLDGTLTDPKEGIINSIVYALRKMKIRIENHEELVSLIGPPLLLSFQKVFGMNETQAQQALQFYREYFKEKGIYENLLYDGIPEMLAALKEAGDKVILATSKPTVFAEEILKHFGIRKYFDLAVGSNLDNTRIKKGEVIGYILETLRPVELDTLVMVGDREHDILGAREHRLDSIGVTFGYGSREELQQAGATAIVDSVSELQVLLLSHS